MRIGLIAAVPLELKHIVRGWDRVPNAARHVKQWQRRGAGGDTVIAVCGGMGPEAVRRSFAAAEQDGPLDVVVSIGLAGATSAELSVGTLLVLGEVIDSNTGERFMLSEGDRTLRIASLPSVADVREKQRIWQTYGAMMVDMESATVARMAQQRKIPVHCIKAISDEANAMLPDINPYLRDGQLRLAPFLASVMVRPRSWWPLVQLGRNSALAARRLAEAIDQFLLQEEWPRVNPAGSEA